MSKKTIDTIVYKLPKASYLTYRQRRLQMDATSVRLINEKTGEIEFESKKKDLVISTNGFFGYMRMFNGKDTIRLTFAKPLSATLVNISFVILAFIFAGLSHVPLGGIMLGIASFNPGVQLLFRNERKSKVRETIEVMAVDGVDGIKYANRFLDPTEIKNAHFTMKLCAPIVGFALAALTTIVILWSFQANLHSKNNPVINLGLLTTLTIFYTMLAMPALRYGADYLYGSRKKDLEDYDLNSYKKD